MTDQDRMMAQMSGRTVAERVLIALVGGRPADTEAYVASLEGLLTRAAHAASHAKHPHAALVAGEAHRTAVRCVGAIMSKITNGGDA